MKKSKSKILAVFFLSFLIPLLSFSASASNPDKHPDVDWSLSCEECHSDMTPEVYIKWENSSHGTAGFACYLCHGDGQETFFTKGTDENCAGCHPTETETFEKANFESCFDCHDGHTLTFHN